MSIHDPSSAQAPSSSTPGQRHDAGAAQPTVQSELRRLTEQRKNLDAQLDVYFSVLSSNNCTMDTPLVDREGFPRADIDVAGVRTARVQVIRLRNDLKAVQSEMEQLVHRGLPKGEAANGAAKDEDAEMRDGVEQDGAEGGERPFARVDAVAPGSPADAAGLKRDDLILTLSSISTSNHDNLRAVAALVARSEGVALPMSVQRGADKLELTLTPRSGWGGRGLLGCHIVPYAP
ncbi:hypothetical protein Rhopal_005691-T1 [Rhodotorula paludigena]|uniref:Probable 26S proteasome regulatory subunit p27 n=1 Tax=Rhodotorula paludigena TaxID=86838 RepID=A0AAV5GJ09_9BASI|nr:hypothetical protein Rhopal_005691-T1 [Rhodotorula paludigena]